MLLVQDDHSKPFITTSSEQSYEMHEAAEFLKKLQIYIHAVWGKTLTTPTSYCRDLDL